MAHDEKQQSKPKAAKDERDKDQVKQAALGNEQVGMKGGGAGAPANPYPDIKADPTDKSDDDEG